MQFQFSIASILALTVLVAVGARVVMLFPNAIYVVLFIVWTIAVGFGIPLLNHIWHRPPPRPRERARYAAYAMGLPCCFVPFCLWLFIALAGHGNAAAGGLMIVFVVLTSLSVIASLVLLPISLVLSPNVRADTGFFVLRVLSLITIIAPLLAALVLDR